MEEERTLPKPDRYAVCAPSGQPIKEYYKGVFEEIFLFYHPFIKPKTLEYTLFNPDTFPNRKESMENCGVLTWAQFLEISGIASFQQLDIGLRTQISGLNKKFSNDEIAKVIQKVCEDKMIVAPSEGCFPGLLITSLLKSIKKEGYEWIWYGDEFCTKRKLEYIDDLVEDNEAFSVHPINLFTHDYKILLTTDWDSHFSLLCGDKQTVNNIVESCRLEGFYCNESTEIYWSLL